MQCTEFEHDLNDWLDGHLTITRAEELDRHTQDCPDCRQLAQDYMPMLTALRGLPAPEMPAGLADRLLDRRRGRTPVRAMAVAASLCLAVALALMLGPRNGAGPDTPSMQWVSLSVAEPRNVQLALSTPTELEGATLTLTLPDHVELKGYPERRELRWTASLREGRNRLALPLIATGRGDGELILRIEHKGKSREMRIGVHANGNTLSMDRSGPQSRDDFYHLSCKQGECYA